MVGPTPPETSPHRHSACANDIRRGGWGYVGADRLAIMRPAHDRHPDNKAQAKPTGLREVDDYGREIRRSVVEHGWAAVAVDSVPPFTYTVGLWRLADHPELIITGLPADTAKRVLDHAVQGVREGRPIRAGTVVDGLIGTYPAAAREVDAARLPELAFAVDLYQGPGFKAIQLVWPDRAGSFPWHARASSDYLEAQPLLFSTSRLGRLFGR